MEGVESGREPNDNVLFVERPEGTSRRVVGVDVWIIEVVRVKACQNLG